MIIHGKERILNWRPALKKPGCNRLFMFAPPPPVPIAPLDIGNIPIWDQGSLGSCTAHGTGFLGAYRLFKQTGVIMTPSRLAIYYWEREADGDVSDDNGACVSDGIDAMKRYGLPPETDWPYDVTQFAVQPPPPCYTDGLKNVAMQENKVPMTVDAIRASLQADYPVGFGFTVFDSFMASDWLASGLMPMPESGEQVDGGHCVAFVGDAPDAGAFWVRNSWGLGWCQSGRFLMPYKNLSNCSDGWNLPKVAA